jgi:hypothetical protein
MLRIIIAAFAFVSSVFGTAMGVEWLINKIKEH